VTGGSDRHQELAEKRKKHKSKGGLSGNAPRMPREPHPARGQTSKEATVKPPQNGNPKQEKIISDNDGTRCVTITIRYNGEKGKLMEVNRRGGAKRRSDKFQELNLRESKGVNQEIQEMAQAGGKR